jgi:hypothetical protein
MAATRKVNVLILFQLICWFMVVSSTVTTLTPQMVNSTSTTNLYLEQIIIILFSTALKFFRRDGIVGTSLPATYLRVSSRKLPMRLLQAALHHWVTITLTWMIAGKLPIVIH